MSLDIEQYDGSTLLSEIIDDIIIEFLITNKILIEET
jgi:hypothetical protein